MNLAPDYFATTDPIHGNQNSSTMATTTTSTHEGTTTTTVKRLASLFDISIFYILGSILLIIHYSFIWLHSRLTQVHSNIHLANMIDLAISRSNQEDHNVQTTTSSHVDSEW
jgi:hypothetical protein